VTQGNATLNFSYFAGPSRQSKETSHPCRSWDAISTARVLGFVGDNQIWSRTLQAAVKTCSDFVSVTGEHLTQHIFPLLFARCF
jgi:hypothetical protein